MGKNDEQRTHPNQARTENMMPVWNEKEKWKKKNDDDDDDDERQKVC